MKKPRLSVQYRCTTCGAMKTLHCAGWDTCKCRCGGEMVLHSYGIDGQKPMYQRYRRSRGWVASEQHGKERSAQGVH